MCFPSGKLCLVLTRDLLDTFSLIESFQCFVVELCMSHQLQPSCMTREGVRQGVQANETDLYKGQFFGACDKV